MPSRVDEHHATRLYATSNSFFNGSNHRLCKCQALNSPSHAWKGRVHTDFCQSTLPMSGTCVPITMTTKRNPNTLLNDIPNSEGIISAGKGIYNKIILTVLNIIIAAHGCYFTSRYETLPRIFGETACPQSVPLVSNLYVSPDRTMS